MYRSTTSFTTKDYDVRPKQILEDDFTTQEEIDEFLRIGYIEVYDDTLEITENGEYDVEDYKTADVNVPSGEPTLQSKEVTITENGTTNITADDGYDALSSVEVEVNVPSSSQGEYNVKVIDYDGTVLKEEWLNAGEEFEMPTPPTHEGLIFDGWGCTEEIVNNKITVIDQDVIAGAYYDTENGSIQFVVEVNDVIGFTVSFLTGLGTIDWGDGTINNSTSHTYNQAGEYTIKSSASLVFTSNIIASTYNSNCYWLKAIHFGKNIVVKLSTRSVFVQYVPNLKSVSFPSEMDTTMSENSSKGIWFNVCNSLKALVLPRNYADLKNRFELGSVNIKYIVIPYGITTLRNVGCIKGNNPLIYPRTIVYLIDDREASNLLETINFPKNITTLKIDDISTCYQDCYRIKEINFPCNIPSIPIQIFQNCYSLRKISFKHNTEVAILTNITYFTVNKLFKIVVPDELYDEWVVANNWSTYASYIIKASEDI